jgi:hypothetical protein
MLIIILNIWGSSYYFKKRKKRGVYKLVGLDQITISTINERKKIYFYNKIYLFFSLIYSHLKIWHTIYF